MSFKLPEKCPMCGVAEKLVEDDDHFHCTDCGSAWPKKAAKASAEADKPKDEEE